MYSVYNWQVLKSSSDDSTIQFEYYVPLSDASSDETTNDHTPSVEEPEHGLEEHSGYDGKWLEVQHIRFDDSK